LFFSTENKSSSPYNDYKISDRLGANLQVNKNELKAIESNRSEEDTGAMNIERCKLKHRIKMTYKEYVPAIFKEVNFAS